MDRNTRRQTRVLLYSHDSQGLGHARRNLALAHALAQHLPRHAGGSVTGLLLSGLDDSPGPLPAGFDRVSLPGICKGDNGYAPRRVDLSMATLSDVRSRILAATVAGFRPDLMIIDRHVFGVDGELRDALAQLRLVHPAARVVLGLREVLDDPVTVQDEWAALGPVSEIRALVDEIWVYGDPQVHDIRATGEIPAGMSDLVRYTGYLSTGRRYVPDPAPVDRPFVLTMVGGGSDGEALCAAAAAAPVPRGYRHLVVTGPQMSDGDRRAVERRAAPGTRVVAVVPDGLATIRDAAALVSMAGYNTVSEVMSTEVPVLLVPREHPRREQLIRATALAAVGAVDLCRAADLSPEAIGRWLAAAVRTTRADPAAPPAPAVPTQASRRAAVDRRGLGAVPRMAADLLPHLTTQEVDSLAV